MIRSGFVTLAGLTLAALLAAACGGEGSPTASLEPSPALTAVASTTPTPAATATPEVVDGVEVVPLQFGEEAELPDDVALIIETGCWQCDGPTTGLYRVYRDASGELRTDTLFTTATTGLQTDGSFIHSYALTSDASEIVVSVCTHGECAWLGEASPDAQSTLYRSLDGGVTWEEFGVLDGKHFIVAIAKEGLLISGPHDQEHDWEPNYTLFPSGEPVQPPPGAREAWPLSLPGGELAWSMEDGRLLRSDGSQILALSEGASVGSVVPEASGEGLIATWWTDQRSSQYFLGTFSPDGRPITTFSLPDYARVGGWLSDTLVAGNVTVPQALLPTPEPGRYVMSFLPAIFDLEAGQANPLAGPFQQPPLGGRNYVQAVLHGPFARVVNTGTCLNVRAEPGMAAAVLACAADGVLLRDTGETREADGEVWLRVVTPAGVEGWASTQYLER